MMNCVYVVAMVLMLKVGAGEGATEDEMVGWHH